jgi:DNA-binding XRE family transcriptional regulator
MVRPHVRIAAHFLIKKSFLMPSDYLLLSGGSNQICSDLICDHCIFRRDKLQESLDRNLKVALVVRAVRGCLGMSQTKFAEFIGVAKSTIARAETLEVPLKVDVYFRVLEAAQKMGLELDAMSAEPTIKLTTDFISREKMVRTQNKADHIPMPPMSE